MPTNGAESNRGSVVVQSACGGTNGFSIEPLKGKLLAGEQRVTEVLSLSQAACRCFGVASRGGLSAGGTKTSPWFLDSHPHAKHSLSVSTGRRGSPFLVWQVEVVLCTLDFCRWQVEVVQITTGYPRFRTKGGQASSWWGSMFHFGRGLWATAEVLPSVLGPSTSSGGDKSP